MQYLTIFYEVNFYIIISLITLDFEWYVKKKADQTENTSQIEHIFLSTKVLYSLRFKIDDVLGSFWCFKIDDVFIYQCTFSLYQKLCNQWYFVVCFVIGWITFNLYFNDIFKIKNKFLNSCAQS